MKKRKGIAGIDRFTAKTAEKQATKQLEKIWCADGKMFDKFQHGGVWDGVYPMPLVVRNKGFHQNQWNNIVIQQISIMLEYKRLNWSVLLLVFQGDDNSEWVTSEWCDDLSEQLLTSNQVGPIVDRRLDKLRNSRNHRHVISYAWFATPKVNIDKADAQQKAIEYFTENNAFDVTYCNMLNADRKLRESA